MEFKQGRDALAKGEGRRREEAERLKSKGGGGGGRMEGMGRLLTQPSSSSHNPSSLRMIIWEALNEAPLHIWNGNNLTLNQMWQARLVSGRGLLLSAAEHRRLNLTESLIDRLQREMSPTTKRHLSIIWMPTSPSVPEYRKQCFSLFMYPKAVSHFFCKKDKRKKKRKENTKVWTFFFMAKILTVLILCVFHHARIFCWEHRKKINHEMIK